MVFAFLPVVVAAVAGVAALDLSSSNIKRHVASLDRRGATEPAVLPPAEFTSSLVAKTPRTSAKKSVVSLLRGQPPKSKAFTGVIDGSDFDEEYITDITVGGQKFLAIVDTGSSDTWIVQRGFQCSDLDRNPQPEAECNFGSSGFNPRASSTFRAERGVNFNITYGDGEFLSGPVGFETVSIAGLTVKNQTIPTPDFTAWFGDGFSSGLIGLAYPDLTSVYSGTDPTVDVLADNLPYNPFFFTAVKQGAVKNPFFSIALDRGTFDQQANDPFDPNLGFLSFGGIAPVPVTRTAVTIPVQGYSVTTGAPTNTNPTFFFYTADVQSYDFIGSTAITTANNNTILDTGTTLNILPDDVAAAYNAAFVPPAVFDEVDGLYIVDCNATAPAFSVTLGGKKFAIDPKDQILPGGTDENGNLVCFSGTAPGGPDDDPRNIFILGDVFLHNVVSTFNIQTNQVTLTERQPY